VKRAIAIYDTSLICDIYCGSEVLFETCDAMKFVDVDDMSESACSSSVCLAHSRVTTKRSKTSKRSTPYDRGTFLVP